MLTFELTDDRKYIKLLDFSLNVERNHLFSFFKKKSKKANFNVLVDRGIWDGNDHFITKEGLIAIGLWKELYAFGEKYGYEIQIDGIDEILGNYPTKEEYQQYVNTLLADVMDERGLPIVPRDYQSEGAYRALKYKFCTEELATSAGKTLIFYIYNSYLRDTGIISSTKKSLLIVPNVSLVAQTAEKFELYSANAKKWKVQIVGGDNKFKQKDFDECELFVSTYQSLQNMPKEFFLNFHVVNVDETHKSRGATIREIIESCTNWTHKLGLSGTVKIDEKYSDFYKMQENVGPLVMVLSAKHLMDNQYSPNVKIKMVYLQYDENNEYLQKYWRLKEDGIQMYKNAKDYGRDMLSIEKKFIYESQERLDFISKLVKKLGKNTLVLFSDVKNGYGKAIQESIFEWNPRTYYIDGGVESDVRDTYKADMENEDNVVIVASFGTFSTGIDLKSVYHIIFAESTKAEITIRQSIGRGMRKLAEKNKVIIWDLVDDLKGYSVKHSKEREKIYVDQEFEVVKNSIDLTKSS